MRKNKAKEKLAAGEPVFQCMTISNAPSVVEVLGRAGFDIVCLDGEHGSVDRQILENLSEAQSASGLAPGIISKDSRKADTKPGPRWLTTILESSFQARKMYERSWRP